jgi:hypothetical protein
VAVSGQGSYCLLPCTTYTDCQLDEICDAQVSPQSCYPNYGCATPWGACAGGNNNAGGSDTGTCNVFSDDQGNAFGVCVAGGSAATNGSCAFNGSWPTISQQCVPGDICGSSNGTSGDCYQACDPTGSLTGAPNCKGGTQCYSEACDCSSDPNCFCSGGQPECDPEYDSSCDPYFGVCQ